MLVKERFHNPEHAVIRIEKGFPADARRYGFAQGVMSRRTDSFT